MCAEQGEGRAAHSQGQLCRLGRAWAVTSSSLLQALISGGLVGLAHDPAFLTVTREEIAASSQLEMDEMEKAALELLKGRKSLQDTKTGTAL